MKKQKGFSLIELLIVVAIILIIAAIAIPNLMRSRMAANEASAVGSLRTINTAEVTYFTNYGTGFAPLANWNEDRLQHRNSDPGRHGHDSCPEHLVCLECGAGNGWSVRRAHILLG